MREVAIAIPHITTVMNEAAEGPYALCDTIS